MMRQRLRLPAVLGWTEELSPSLVACMCGSAWLALCWLLGSMGSGD